MAITTLDGYIASAKQRVIFQKSASLTAVAGFGARAFAQAGVPGAGTLAVGNTANGLVHTDAIAGYPTIGTINNTGYISKVEYQSSVACQIIICDTLFSAGAYAYNANTTLASQPSYASRVPGGTDFKNTEIWLEAVTAFTGNQSIAITYTDQDGNAGATTGTIATGIAPIVGRMYRMPLASGDCGVQKIESVVSSVSTAGTFNVHVMRPLCSLFVPSAYFGGVLDLMGTGMPRIFSDSALSFIIIPVSTATGLPSVAVEVADG